MAKSTWLAAVPVSGGHFDVLGLRGMWRNDGMKNIKRSTITTTYEKPNFWMSSNSSIKRVVSRSRHQKYNSTLNWYKNSTKVRAQKGCDMLRHFPKQTSCSFMDSNSKWIGRIRSDSFLFSQQKSAPEHKATIALLRDAISLRLTSIPGWQLQIWSCRERAAKCATKKISTKWTSSKSIGRLGVQALEIASTFQSMEIRTQHQNTSKVSNMEICWRYSHLLPSFHPILHAVCRFCCSCFFFCASSFLAWSHSANSLVSTESTVMASWTRILLSHDPHIL